MRALDLNLWKFDSMLNSLMLLERIRIIYKSFYGRSKHNVHAWYPVFKWTQVVPDSDLFICVAKREEIWHLDCQEVLQI